MTETALFTLLHVLVLVYWLGGDLGAFYTSRFLIRPGISADRRLMAAKIVGDVDMAPRTALILTLPTGLSLANTTGWMALPVAVLAVIWIASLGWLGLAWAIHQKHGAAPALWRQVDLAIRWGLVLALVASAFGALAGHVSVPDFLAIKLLLLAGCILLGLYIRAVLVPLGPALAGLGGDHAVEAEQRLATTLNRARPLVSGIWALLVAAAWIGVSKPSLT